MGETHPTNSPILMIGWMIKPDPTSQNCWCIGCGASSNNSIGENFDHLAKFTGIVATAFITAKLPVLIGSVTGAISALTAISANPLGLLAIGVTSAGAAALFIKTCAEYFGFADEALAGKTLEKNC